MTYFEKRLIKAMNERLNQVKEHLDRYSKEELIELRRWEEGQAINYSSWALFLEDSIHGVYGKTEKEYFDKRSKVFEKFCSMSWDIIHAIDAELEKRD